MFEANGAAYGDTFRVNATVNLNQASPSLTALADGGFALAWTDASGASDDRSELAIRAQIFSAAGARVSGELLINTSFEGSQVSPVVTALADGGLLTLERAFVAPLQPLIISLRRTQLPASKAAA
jgi:hypothetical protein